MKMNLTLKDLILVLVFITFLTSPFSLFSEWRNKSQQLFNSNIIEITQTLIGFSKSFNESIVSPMYNAATNVILAIDEVIPDVEVTPLSSNDNTPTYSVAGIYSLLSNGQNNSLKLSPLGDLRKLKLVLSNIVDSFSPAYASSNYIRPKYKERVSQINLVLSKQSLDPNRLY